MSSPRRCAATIRCRPATGASRRGSRRRGARPRLQRDARPARVRAARQCARRADAPGGRTPPGRPRAPRRGRPDAHRRDAAGRRPARPRSPTDLRDQLDELRETARHGTEEVRRIARRLRPEALEDLGLQSALAALATAFGEQAPDRGPAAPGTRPRAHRRTGARRLPRRPGGADQCRAPRRGDARSSCGSNTTTAGRCSPSPTTAAASRRVAALRARHPRHARARDADRRRPDHRPRARRRHRSSTHHPPRPCEHQ